MTDDRLNRRDFVQQTAAAGMMVYALQAAARADEEAPAGPPVPVAVIGTGAWGRELMRQLVALPCAELKAVCDSSAAALRGAAKVAENVPTVEDYKAILDDKAIPAIVVATPTHLHKDIVLEALQAGKHVYVEAPLAHSLADAKAIAKAGMAAKTVCQAGLQYRCNPIHEHTRKTIMAGGIGNFVGCRAQWHQRGSWYRATGDEQRDRELNWKLFSDTSAGLAGEVGIHQIDIISWMLKKLPEKVEGAGGILAWNQDPRELADTIDCLLHYPRGVRLNYGATLTNSFDGAYELLLGVAGSVLMKQNRAWLFKESDAVELGWEVYAAKEQIGDESGLKLVAGSTKLLAAGEEPSKHARPDPNPAHYYSLEAFCRSIQTKADPAVDAETGYQATVVAIKTNEAVMKGATVAIPDELYDYE